ncbi:MAG: type II toxin-antitoxin system PemK/MazF family toxin [Calditrichales bacterium]|nr:type II toxin-antitoxin system PemK/MazF family toxin [Calditrichales bacterium]
MKSTTTYKKWDIILVPFPFTDLTTSKKRPGLVISPDEYNKGPDILILFITSKLDREERLGDYKIERWDESKLPKPSMIRMKFATIDKSIVVKKIGRLSEFDISEFHKKIINFFNK